MFCPNCGKKIDHRMEQCPHCGKDIPEDIKERLPEPPAPESVFESQEPTAEISHVQPSQPVNAAVMPSEPTKKRGKSPVVKILLITIPLILIACVVIIAGMFYFRPGWLPFELPSIGLFESKPSSDILVMVYEGQAEYDISIIRGEETIEAFDDIKVPASSLSFSSQYIEDGLVKTMLPGSSIIPNSDYFYTWYMDDDTQIFTLYNMRTEEVTEIFDSEQRFIASYILNDETIIFIERREDDQRAYVSMNYGPAERVLKSDNRIRYLPGLNQFLVYENDEDRMSVVLYDLNGDELGEVYQGDEPIDSMTSDNGKLFAATFLEENEQVIRVFDLVSLNEMDSLEGYAEILKLDSAEDASLMYAIAANEEGMIYLEAFWEGEWQTLVEEELFISANTEGNTGDLAYIVCQTEEADCTVFTADLTSGETSEVFDSSDSLAFYRTPISISGRFLLKEMSPSGDYRLYSFDYTTGESLELLNEADVESIRISAEEDILFVSIQYTDEDTAEYVCSPFQEGGYILTEDWYAFSVWDLSDDKTDILIIGREDKDDDLGIFTAKLEEDAEIKTLDDDSDIFQIVNLSFMPGNKEAVYFVSLSPDRSETELRIVSVAEEKKPDAILDDVAMVSFDWEYEMYAALPFIREVNFTQAKLIPQLEVNEVYEGEMPGNEQDYVFRFTSDPELVYWMVIESEEETGFDPAVSIADLNGNILRTEDFYDENVENFFFNSMGEEELEITVSNNVEDHGDLTFNYWINSLETYPIEFGELVSGEITSDEYINASGELKYYADFYTFYAEEGDVIFVEVQGTEIVPRYVNIMSPGMIVTSGDYQDSEKEFGFTATIFETGTHYVFVGDNDYESYANHQYSLKIDDVENVVEEETVEEEEAAEEEEIPTGPMTFRVATAIEPDSLDPHKTDYDISVEILSLVGASLVSIDPDGNIIPYLAESWEISEDGLTYTFHLRDDVTFHDGTPLVAQDFVYTYERSLDPEIDALIFDRVNSFSAPDDYTLVITLEEPHFPFLYTVANAAYCQPMSREYVESVGDDELSRAPMSVGPYKIVEWISGDHILLEKNEDYVWGPEVYGSGPFRIDYYEFLIVSDPAIINVLLEAGEINYASMEFENLSYFEGSSFNILESPQAGLMPYVAFQTTVAPLDDFNVRKALNMAIDRKTALEMLEQGNGVIQFGPLSPGQLGYWEGVEEYGYPYDPEQAMALLEESGYVKNADGFYEKNGEILSLVLNTYNYENRVGEAEVIRAMLMEIGVQVVIEQFERSDLYTILFNGEYQMTMLGMSGQDADFMYYLFHSSNIGSWNYAYVNDPELDAILDQTRTLVDPDERQQMVNEAQKFIAQQAYFIPLYAPINHFVISSNVKNYIFSPLTGLWLNQAYIK